MEVLENSESSLKKVQNNSNQVQQKIHNPTLPLKLTEEQKLAIKSQIPLKKGDNSLNAEQAFSDNKIQQNTEQKTIPEQPPKLNDKVFKEDKLGISKGQTNQSEIKIEPKIQNQNSESQKFDLNLINEAKELGRQVIENKDSKGFYAKMKEHIEVIDKALGDDLSKNENSTLVNKTLKGISNMLGARKPSKNAKNSSSLAISGLKSYLENNKESKNIKLLTLSSVISNLEEAKKNTPFMSKASNKLKDSIEKLYNMAKEERVKVANSKEQNNSFQR